MKIDCSKTVNYLKEKIRMTNMCGILCENCPISSSNNKMSINCHELQYEYPKKAIEIVQKWSDEHPQKTQKTRLEDFLEKYPNANKRIVVEKACVEALGYKRENCASYKCEDCWNMPV